MAIKSGARLAWHEREHYLCITLNGAGEVIETRVVTVGLLDSAQIHPREVFADALVDRAAGVILVHNHPSGNLEPSPEDIAITRRLVEAGKLLGIEVLDHIIISPLGIFPLKNVASFDNTSLKPANPCRRESPPDAIPFNHAPDRLTD